MRPRWLAVPALLAVLVAAGAGQQPKSQTRKTATVTGVFLGRSGKPMARARLFLGQFVAEGVLMYSKIRLVAQTPYAITDEKGRFQFTGVTPGKYTIVYQPRGITAYPLAEFGIKSLSAVTRSILPLLKDVEIGATGEPRPAQAWGREYTLLKGHTFYALGPNMKIWNATVRKGQNGPFLEVRKGIIWQQDLEDKSQINLEAWSY